MLTGNASRLETPMRVLSKGHCRICRESRHVRHTVCPHARDTGGFFVACDTKIVAWLFCPLMAEVYKEYFLTSNSCLHTGHERYSDHCGPWTGIVMFS